MGVLFEKILDERNIYAAAYALTGYLKETGLIAAIKKTDIDLYKKLMYKSYCLDDELIKECHEMLVQKLTAQDDELFTVKVFFKFKKKLADGSPVYRPIHTTDIKTLICIQSIANAIYFDDDYEKGHRRISCLNKLIPQNFWGNILTENVEYLYENWANRYKDYVRTSIQKHDKYVDTKQYGYEAYLDLVNCFPNINTKILYNDIRQRLTGVYEEAELEKVLRLLLCFAIDEKFNSAEQEAYYGTVLKDDTLLYTKGLPQGLPHCFFLANLYLVHIKNIVEKNIDCDIDYYVDDMTLFCNLDHDSLIRKVEQINKDIASSLSSNLSSPLEKANEFYTNNAIKFELKVHEDEEKCSSIAIGDKKGSLGNMSILARRASEVGENVRINFSENGMTSTLSQVECLLKAIKKEKKLIAKQNGDEIALYRKRLESYYKFYKLRKDLILQKLNILPTDNPKSFPNVEHLMQDGILQQTYRVWLRYKSEDKEYVENIITKYCSSNNGQNGIPEKHLYFSADCMNFLKTYAIHEPTTKYACLYQEAKKNIEDWSHTNFSIRQFVDNVRNSIAPSENRSFVYKASREFQRNQLIAYFCLLYHLPISVKNSYTTTIFKPLSWNKLRIVHYLYQRPFDMVKFIGFVDKVLQDNVHGRYTGSSDPLIYKVLPLFLNTVIGHENNDDLILAHYYVQSIWKNGSKFLHFFTLHNVEHSVELILQSYLISRTFSVYHLTTVDYFFLFMSCYLHDISLITYPDVHTFKISNGEHINGVGIREKAIEAFKKVDSYFENAIRDPHAEESAKQIRTNKAFSFLQDSTRDIVADISASHGIDSEKIYGLSKDKENNVNNVMTRLHLMHVKSILRLADSLDMSQDRVSPIYLDNTSELMPKISKFHWISHLAINYCSISAKYKSQLAGKVDDSISYLTPNSLKENVTLNIYFNTKLNIISSTVCHEPCENTKVSTESNGYRIDMSSGICDKVASRQCPLLCKWMHKKNSYINSELFQIAMMSKKSEEKTFTTTVDVRYIFNDDNRIVDKYIPFIDEYLNDDNN